MNREVLKEFFHSNISKPVEYGEKFGSIDSESNTLIMKAVNKWKWNERGEKFEWEEAKNVLIEVASDRGMLTAVDDTKDVEILLIDAIAKIIDGMEAIQRYLIVKKGI